jgi:hypothetical protein
MRVVSDELRAEVKARQEEIGELFNYASANRLNGMHRQKYLLSRLLECEEYAGPHAISAKGRYSCTNHCKRLPIDQLGGACCGNTKTTTRQDLEQRVRDCLPSAFLSLGSFDRISVSVIDMETSKLRKQARV